MSTLGFDPDRLERVADICHWYVDEGKLPGTSVLVARHGEVVYRSIPSKVTRSCS